MRLLLILVLAAAKMIAEPVFREDFREVPAHIPVVADDLSSGFLTLARLGPGAGKLKLSHHPEVVNDPHYVWNGECPGPVVIAFPFRKALDLSGDHWSVRLRTKNVGQSTLHVAVRSGGQWFVQLDPVANKDEWNIQTIPLAGKSWLLLDPGEVKFGAADRPGFDAIDALGFAAPQTPDRSKDCIRLDWFELAQVATR